MIDLERKQKVWSEQLPVFKENYILTADLNFLDFDMTTGQFDIKPNQGNDGFDNEDSLVLYHSVNTAWAMWLRCNRLNQAEIESLKAQLAKIESGEFVVVPKEPTLKMLKVADKHVMDCNATPESAYKAMIEAAQENSHE